MKSVFILQMLHISFNQAQVYYEYESENKNVKSFILFLYCKF